MKNSLCFIAVVSFALQVAFTAQSAEYDSDLITVTAQGTLDSKKHNVVLIHGFASSSDVWSGTVEQLSDDFNIHLVQVKGSAGTESPKELPKHYLKSVQDNLIQYIKLEELEQPTLVGHSMGGLLSLMIGSQEPKLVNKIIVVDALPFYSLMFNPMATSEQMKPMAEQVKKQMLTLGDEQFANQVERSSKIMTQIEEKQELVADWSLNTDREVYGNLIAEIMAYDARSELPQIEAPVIVINAFDKNMPMNKESLTNLYKTAYSGTKAFELRTVDDSYHFIMWDRAEAFYQQLEQALGE